MKFVLGALLVLVAVPGLYARHGSAAKSHSKPAARSGSSRTAHSASKGQSRSRGRYAARRRRPAAPSFQLHPSPERYKEIQQALADRGYFKGTVDGEWGTDSVEALKRFQTEHNAGDDGKINSLSLIQLGLGPQRDHLENSTAPTSSASVTGTLTPPRVAASVSNPAAEVDQPATLPAQP